MLMRDNVLYSTYHWQFIEEVGRKTMKWPVLSPNMNPIEHLWDKLKRRIRVKNPASTTIELKIVLAEKCSGIPQNPKKVYEENKCRPL